MSNCVQCGKPGIWRVSSVDDVCTCQDCEAAMTVARAIDRQFEESFAHPFSEVAGSIGVLNEKGARPIDGRLETWPEIARRLSEGLTFTIPGPAVPTEFIVHRTMLDGTSKVSTIKIDCSGPGPNDETLGRSRAARRRYEEKATAYCNGEVSEEELSELDAIEARACAAASRRREIERTRAADAAAAALAEDGEFGRTTRPDPPLARPVAPDLERDEPESCPCCDHGYFR